MKTFFAAAMAVMLATPVLAGVVVQPPASTEADSTVDKFREAYVAGSGLTYVRMADETGTERMYRFGNWSRNGVASQAGDHITFWLYTCTSQRRIVLPDDTGVVVAAKPQLIKSGEDGYNTAEKTYMNGCYNPVSWFNTLLSPRAPAGK